MLSGITQTPELALDISEAANLAQALDTVNKFYNVEVAEKTIAWTNLAMVAGMIYGTRLVAIRMRRQSERRAPPRDVTPNKAQDNTTDAPQAASTEAAYSGIPDDFVPTANFPGMGPFGV